MNNCYYSYLWNRFITNFLLISIIVVCEQTSGQYTNNRNNCVKYEWQCKNGECIASDELCDGRTDCRDGSDETAESCIHIRCPKYSFRCAYGACVSGDAECNGKKECADNSDETSISCPGVLQNITLRGSCGDDEFQCTDGPCISIDNACDGKADCKDGSDETVKICASTYCPSFAFRCGYGACINGAAKCDGVKDCYDGSDETPSLCGRLHTTEPPGDVSEEVTRPPLSQTTEVTVPIENGCKLDELSNVLYAYESNPNDNIRTKYVPNYSSIVYKCRPKHLLVGQPTNFCLNGNWLLGIPSCVRYCSSVPIIGVTFQATCEYNRTRVSCFRDVIVGTRAMITCEFGYVKPDRVVQEVLVCQDNGQWDYYPFRCEPVCGTEPIQSKPFIMGGEAINNTLVPWHVSIYRLNDRGSYDAICGGTIINAKVVVSAAHCFWDVYTGRSYDKSIFAIGAGKYFKDYYATEPTPPQFLNLSELHIPSIYNDAELSFQADIAVLVLSDYIRFKSNIKPICMEWQNNNNRAIPSDKSGRIPGFGKIDNSLESEVLRVADIPTISYEECVRRASDQYKQKITNDKFCIGTHNEMNVCSGDSGGGFVIPKYIGGTKTFFLWGIISNGLVNQLSECVGEYLSALTNVQFYSQLIIEYESKNRPK